MKQLLFLFLTLVASSCMLLAQDVRLLILLAEKTPMRVKNFHITRVLDDRSDTSSIGNIMVGLINKKNVTLNLQNGVSVSLQNYIRNNFVQDTGTTPIELHISELKAKQLATGFKGRTDVLLAVAFFSGSEKISQWNGSGYFEGGDPLKYIEEMIRKNLQNGLEQFDEWWLKNKNQYYSSKGAPRSVTVQVELNKTINNSDMIVYALNRPLAVSDFAARPEELSVATAITNSGMFITYDTETKDGQAAIHVHITPYFDTKKSWFRKNNRIAKTLLHEQKHFDITALKACELVEAIHNFTFSANYVRELDQLNKQKQKECDQMQADYDAQTKHGQLMAEQEKWNKLIAEELAKRSCF